MKRSLSFSISSTRRNLNLRTIFGLLILVPKYSLDHMPFYTQHHRIIDGIMYLVTHSQVIYCTIYQVCTAIWLNRLSNPLKKIFSPTSKSQQKRTYSKKLAKIIYCNNVFFFFKTVKLAFVYYCHHSIWCVLVYSLWFWKFYQITSKYWCNLNSCQRPILTVQKKWRSHPEQQKKMEKEKETLANCCFFAQEKNTIWSKWTSQANLKWTKNPLLFTQHTTHY